MRRQNILHHIIPVISGWLLALSFVQHTSGQSPFACGFLNSSDQRPSHTFHRTTTTTTTTTTDQMNIGVVFHIVYANAEQLSARQRIYDQVDVINKDFSKQNSNASETVAEFKTLAGNPNVWFYVAGITETITSHGPFSNDDVHFTSRGGRDAWDPRRFLNVWVADLGSQLYGYASSPGSPAFRDGVVIHHSFFGNQPALGNLGRTLTHEIGHWLGLQHLWGNGGCDSDDGIEDTPVQDHPVGGCALDYRSCGGLNMVQNFMNSSADACMSLFTVNQAAFMRQTLQDARPEVFTLGEIVTDVEAETVIAEAYPNPLTKGSVVTMSLKWPTVGTTTVDILNSVGQKTKTSTVAPAGQSVSIDFDGLPDGVYLARVCQGSGEQMVRIVVNRNF